MTALVVLLVVAAVAALVLVARACGDDTSDDTRPERGIPVAGLSGAPRGASPEAPFVEQVTPSPARPSASPAGLASDDLSLPADDHDASGDWAGTWLLVGDPLAGIIIERGSDGTYRGGAPDGSSEVTFYPLGERRLVAMLTVTEDGDSSPMRIVLTMDPSGDLITLEQVGVGEAKSWELRRAE